MKYPTRYGLLALGMCTFIASNSYARIKLITLPVREHVEIQLEHKNTTIIEEERIVPLRKGNNDIDFSWQNTAIRPETIVFRVIEDSDSISDKSLNKSNLKSNLKTNVLSVSYPPNESALTWKVSASDNGSARVRITYAIKGLTRNYHYIARVSEDETSMAMMQYIKINNQSGESFRNASMNTGTDKTISLPLGLNETQEFLNQKYTSVPVEKTYTVNASELGYSNRAEDKLKVLMHYKLYNDSEHNLGKTALAAGKFRLYQQDKNATAVFIGEDWGKYTAKNNDSQLFVGQAQDIVVKRTIENKKRQRVSGNLYHIDAVVKYEIENFKDKAVTLIIEESIVQLRNEVFPVRRSSSEQTVIEWQVGDSTTFTGEPLRKRLSADKIAYQITLPPRNAEEKVVKLEEKLHINFSNEW